MYLNKVFLYGNLTRDPELRAMPTGNNVVNFGLATNRVYKDKNGAKQENTEFHNIVSFGKQAEILAQYLKKGNPVFIEGRLQTRSWDAEGTKKYRTEIIVDSFLFGPKGMGMPFKGSPSDKKEEIPQVAEPSIEYPEEQINPEDIPF